MLSGRPPFHGNSTLDVLETIKRGPFLTAGVWNAISVSAKDLIRKMLTTNPAQRPSAQEVLNHPWIQSRVNNSLEENPLSTEAFTHLASFRATTKLEKSILTFITAQIFGEKEEAELVELFKALDTNGDGKLSRDELQSGYRKLKLASPEQIEEIMKNCDSDGSGFIDFTEFITAATN